MVNPADRGWPPLAYPQDPVMRVSHETIYLSLFIWSRRSCAGRWVKLVLQLRPQARLEPEGTFELRPQRLGCLPWRNGGALVNATERPEQASLVGQWRIVSYYTTDRTVASYPP
jgi:hypothetical protein